MNREDQKRDDEEIDFMREDVHAGVNALIDNAYFGDDRELDEDDLAEIVRLVLSYATKGVREAAYRAGREDAARRFRKLVERFRDEYADGGALPRSDEWHAIDDLLQRLDDDHAGEQQ